MYIRRIPPSHIHQLEQLTERFLTLKEPFLSPSIPKQFFVIRHNPLDCKKLSKLDRQTQQISFKSYTPISPQVVPEATMAPAPVNNNNAKSNADTGQRVILSNGSVKNLEDMSVREGEQERD